MDIYPHDKFILLEALILVYEQGFDGDFELSKWSKIHDKYNHYYSKIKPSEIDKIEKESIKKLIDFFFEEIENLDSNLTIDSYK